MKKKNWILPGLVAFLVVAGSLTVGFSSRASVQKQKNNSTCCQKMKECSSEEAASPGGTILDNLSRQFMSIFAVGY